MRLALREARRGLGRTSPNPAVGAVLVKGGRVVGRGHHARAGAPHAEVMAIRARRGAGAGAPTSTPRSSPATTSGGRRPAPRPSWRPGCGGSSPARATPIPRVNGRGIRRLRRAGVEVEAGVLREDCDALNEPWFRFITTGRPHVTLKVAATLDGRIATASGDSRWVTGAGGPRPGPPAPRRRRRGAGGRRHGPRRRPPADRPAPRGRGRDPLRVVLDSRLELPPGLRLFRQRSAAPTLVAHVAGTPPAAPRGVEYLRCRARRGRVDLATCSPGWGGGASRPLLVEGGAEVARSPARGRAGRPAAPLRGAEARRAEGSPGSAAGAGPDGRRAPGARSRVRRLGRDLLLTGRPAAKGDRTPRVD